MKKKWKYGDFLHRKLPVNLIIMKLLIVFLFICSVNLNASVFSQQKRMDVSFKETSVVEIFRHVRQVGQYTFMYDSDAMKRLPLVSIDLKDATILEIMDYCLKGSSFIYIVEDDLVIIRERQAKEEKKSVTLKGWVYDTGKAPLPGVTIKVAGLTVGTATDMKGWFSLTLPVMRGILEFSFVGYQKQQVAFTEETDTLKVTLLEDITNLEEVNVISTGYQRINKREQASSVVKLDQSAINLGAQTSVDQMLAGQVPGMMVLQSSGEPGVAPKIRIRGTSSIIGTRTPIWVLDGIILEDPVNVDVTNLDSPDASYLIGSAIAGVNARDIESITVLKDASATAIYGVRAANGVIVVTTKKGVAGKLQVAYSGNLTWNKRVSYGELQLMNAGERVKLSQEIIADNARYSQVPYSIGYEGLYIDYCNNKITYAEFQRKVNEMVNRNTDWYDILFRNTISHNHSLSLSGGHDRTTYYASLSYADTPGTARGSEQKSYSGMLKLNSWLTSKVYAGLQLNASKVESQGFHSSMNPNKYAYETSRTMPCWNEDGSLHYYQTNQASTTSGLKFGEEMKYNVLNEMERTGADSDVTNLTVQFNFEWKLYKGLEYRLLFGFDQSRSTKRSWAEEASNYVSMRRGYNVGVLQPGTVEFEKSTIPWGGILDNDEQRKESYTLRNTLNLNKVIADDHFISLMGVQEVRSVKYKGINGTYYGYMPDRGMTLSPAITEAYVDMLSTLSPGLTDYVNNNLSWLGSFSYSYKDTWTLNANVRADGSNNFGENPEYKFLPVWSVAGKYTVSNERFMSALPVISYLAVRGSYGIQGNIDKSSTPHLIMQVGDKNVETGLNESYFKYYANPSLRWEKTKSWNIGLDFTVGGSKNPNLVSGTIDLYRKMGNDMITNCDISQVHGTSNTKINGGKLLNRGIEGSVVFTPCKTDNFDVTVKVIASYNENELIKASSEYNLSDDNKVKGTALVEGKALGSFYSVPFAGINPENGYPMYYNDKGEKRYDIYAGEVALVYSGVNEPNFTGGFDVGFRFKGLYFSAGFQYALGGIDRLPEIYGSNVYNTLEPMRNVSKEYKDRWKNEGDIADIPKIINREEFDKINIRFKNENNLVTTDTRYTNLAAYDISDHRVEKTDNLRLRNVNLTYVLPHDMVRKKLGMEAIVLTFQCQNLFLIADKRWGGRDPESGSSNIPLPKIFTFGINVDF